jgi:hypothetical protein
MNAHRPDRKRRNGLAAFRALEPEVRAALDAGWTLTAIFELHQRRLAMSYAQFARYAQPFRQATRAARAPAAVLARDRIAARVPASAPARTDPSTGNGPVRGRPEDAVPTLDMDGFATKALASEDLF